MRCLAGGSVLQPPGGCKVNPVIGLGSFCCEKTEVQVEVKAHVKVTSKLRLKLCLWLREMTVESSGYKIEFSTSSVECRALSAQSATQKRRNL